MHLVRNTIILVLLGILILALFTFQLTSIARHDFYVAHHFAGLIPRLMGLTYWFSGFLLALVLALHFMKDYPNRWSMAIVLIVFLGLAVIAIFTHPTRSQDIYWSLLLGKGFSHFHLNPYTTQPILLAKDAWAYPVLTWKDIPMIYGPIWALVIIVATWFTNSLAAALLTMKLFFVLVVGLSGYLVWKIGGAKPLALFLWNPFVIQIALVDLHNDALIMLSFLASYWFLQKKNYAASMLALILGGFVKYIPWLFLLIPLWYLFKDKQLGAKRYTHLGIAAIMGVALTGLLYAPFGGFSWHNFAGLATQVENIGLASQYLPGTGLLIAFLQLNFAQLHWLGLGLALVVMIWCLYKNKTLLAYILPILVILFFATPWFQSWYSLWVLPLMILAWSPFIIVVVSIFLLFTPELVSPATMSLIIPAYAMYGYTINAIWKQIKVEP